jgi:hypothetical protein
MSEREVEAKRRALACSLRNGAYGTAGKDELARSLPTLWKRTFVEDLGRRAGRLKRALASGQPLACFREVSAASKEGQLTRASLFAPPVALNHARCVVLVLLLVFFFFLLLLLVFVLAHACPPPAGPQRLCLLCLFCLLFLLLCLLRVSLTVLII